MDNMPEELVLYGMAECMAGEVAGEVKLYLWNTAVPALSGHRKGRERQLDGRRPVARQRSPPWSRGATLASSTHSIASPAVTHAATRGCAGTAVHRFEGAGHLQVSATQRGPRGPLPSAVLRSATDAYARSDPVQRPDPNRERHPVDPNITFAMALTSRSPTSKQLKNIHLGYEASALWITTRMKNNT